MSQPINDLISTFTNLAPLTQALAVIALVALIALLSLLVTVAVNAARIRWASRAGRRASVAAAEVIPPPTSRAMDSRAIRSTCASSAQRTSLAPPSSPLAGIARMRLPSSPRCASASTQRSAAKTPPRPSATSISSGASRTSPSRSQGAMCASATTCASGVVSSPPLTVARSGLAAPHAIRR